MKIPVCYRTHGKFKNLNLSLYVFALSTYANAIFADQQASVSLPPITVTAKDTDNWAPTFEMPLNKNAITIKQEELDRSIQRSVAETLRGRPGIMENTANPGRENFMQLQGVTAGQNAITFDGVPLLSTVPGLNWLDAISPEAIGDISITTGSDHAYNALQGLSGTVRMSSRKAKQNNFSTHVEGGTFGTLRGTLSGGLTGSLGSVQAVGSRYDLFDGSYHTMPHAGQNERDPMHSTFGIMRYDTELGKNATLDGSVLYREGFYNFDFLTKGANGVPIGFDALNTWFASRLWLAQNSLSVEVGKHWQSTLQLGFTRNDVTSGIIGYNFGFATQLMFADWKNNVQLLEDDGTRHLQLKWGGHLRKESGEKNNPGQPGSEAERTVAAGYAELQGRWRDVYLEGGLRLEHQSHYGTHALLHFAGNWQVDDTLTLRAKGGSSFRPPDYGELINTIAGNPNMTSEQGFNGEAGFDWTPNKQTQVSLTGFYGRYNGLVNLQIHPNDPNYTFGNILHARIYGIESSLHYQFNESLYQGLDYTYLHAEDLDTHLTIAMRPKHSARFWLEWRNPSIPLSLRMTLQYRSRFYNGQGENFPIGEAVRINLLATYKVSPALDFYVRGENLNDNRTSESWAAYSPGATVYGGMHMRF